MESGEVVFGALDGNCTHGEDAADTMGTHDGKEGGVEGGVRRWVEVFVFYVWTEEGDDGGRMCDGGRKGCAVEQVAFDDLVKEMEVNSHPSRTSWTPPCTYLNERICCQI